MRRATAVAIVLVAAGLAGCRERPAEPVVNRLFVPGRANTTPSLAALEDRVALVWSAASASEGTGIFAATSQDGGRTFGAPVRVDDGAAEPRASGEQPPQAAWSGATLVVVWGARREGLSEIRYTRSQDGGRSFEPSGLVHGAGLPGLRGWASLGATTDGRMAVAWLDGRNAAPMPAAGHVHGAPGRAAPRQDLFYARLSPDGPADETLVADHVCFCCKTSVVADGSGADVAFRHIFPESMRDIAWARLDATGARQVLVRVSEDKWQIDACPDDGPALAIDAAGTRHVVWPTLVAGAVPAKGIFYARSPDGTVFTPRERLDDGTSTSPSHPRLALTDDGGAAAAWDERVDGSLRVLLRRRSPSGAWSEPETLTGEVAGYYPSLAAVPGGLTIAWVEQTSSEPVIVIERRPAN